MFVDLISPSAGWLVDRPADRGSGSGAFGILRGWLIDVPVCGPFAMLYGITVDPPEGPPISVLFDSEPGLFGMLT